MRRREFITLLGGAAAALPLAARAQQSGRMRRIGVLMSYAADDPAGQARLLAFAQELAQSGWIDGRVGREGNRFRRVAANALRIDRGPADVNADVAGIPFHSMALLTDAPIRFQLLWAAGSTNAL
jgi:hypothetical protein